jgi:peptidyl-prolyl cis-trans isomerase SurA|tara:strand:+ start:43632 stop:45587 length:1956 start_codon:yes stop_codon:yes gene_type:complete
MNKFKLIVLLFLVNLNASAQTDPVILEIDNHTVTKSEFLQIYLKNNNAPKYDKASLDEYMVLFKKFKLKVAEAEALGYDTIPKLKKELSGYRTQLSTPYLTDSEMNEYLVKEAYDRMENEIRASHILIRVQPDSSPADTARAYARIMALRKQILAGDNFEMIAKGKTGSEDPSVAQNGGDLGYFTAFQMVSPFEDAAYNTPVGQVSIPVRTKFGYHLIYVTDKRKARGTMAAAHIMIASPKDADEEDQLNAKRKIDELHTKLIDGEDFETLAKQFSDDPSTNSKGGALPLFGTGTTTRMVTNFEDAAFALTKDGDFTNPIQTDYGWHIIKRLELTPLAPFESMKKELQAKVNRDDRAKKTQDSFVRKLKDEYDYKGKSKSRLKWFANNLDSTYFIGRWDASKLKSDKVLFKLDGQKYRQKDFANYLASNYRGTPKESFDGIVSNKYKAYEKDRILGYEESKLESKYPAFKSLMQEYHDGILLYEVMTDKVWSKAMKDSAGLANYFEANRQNYKWDVRYDAMVYECLDENIANQVHKMILNDTINSKHVIDKINKDSELNLKVRTNKYEVDETAFFKGRDLSKGVNKPYEFDGKYYVVKVAEIIPAGMKELSECKGAATSDYQNYLEKEWLTELEKKHPIIVHEDVLYSLGK